MKIVAITVCFALLLLGCIESFDPPESAYDGTLVVDGVLTDEEVPSTIVLSRSFDFSKKRRPRKKHSLLPLGI